MLLKLSLFTFNITSFILLVLFICLGSQNLEKRYSLDLIVNETVELPNGFIVGIAFAIGFLGGGLTSISLMED